MKSFSRLKQDVAEFRLPDDRKSRVKLFASLAVCGVCAVWLIYFAISSYHPSPRAKPPASPAWTAVYELNAKFAERHEFGDVGATVATESPIRLKITGMVRTPKEMDSLKQFLSEARPQEDYDMDVIILGQPR